MMTWLDDARAGYVLAAYGITAAALLALVLTTCARWRRARDAWARIVAARDEPPAL